MNGKEEADVYSDEVETVESETRGEISPQFSSTIFFE